MAELAQGFVPPLEGFAAGRHGHRDGAAGVIIVEAKSAGLATVVARRDRCAALSDRLRSAFAIGLPAAGRWAQGEGSSQGSSQGFSRGLSLVWSGPGRWLACRIPAPDQGMEDHLRGACGGLAAIVDQSHAGMLISATGRRIRDALAKGLPIDLDPRVFGVGHAAVTAVAQVGVHLWQINEQPTYRLLVPRSCARSFWHWLSAASAEFGLELDRSAHTGVGG